MEESSHFLLFLLLMLTFVTRFGLHNYICTYINVYLLQKAKEEKEQIVVVIIFLDNHVLHASWAS